MTTKNIIQAFKLIMCHIVYKTILSSFSHCYIHAVSPTLLNYRKLDFLYNKPDFYLFYFIFTYIVNVVTILYTCTLSVSLLKLTNALSFQL